MKTSMICLILLILLSLGSTNIHLDNYKCVVLRSGSNEEII